MGKHDSWKPLAITVMFLSCAHASGKVEEEIDIRYAVIGACLGTVFAVAFIVIKLYMIKKHMLDNNFSEGEMEIPLEK
ncbi:transmembrane protein 273 isoform X2 [Pseudophryne corroboree]|uniref:transmembrane protein 273 isoform X2 n=1 Tax=Pseudophryne corroboree TaxID=495146 RepID=UPI0030816E2E